MNCPNCNRELRIATEQVGVDSNNKPVFHRFAYCDTCMRKKDLDLPQNNQEENKEVCPICGRVLRINKEQVGVDANNQPIFHRFAYCDTCMRKKDLDLPQNNLAVSNVAQSIGSVPNQQISSGSLDSQYNTNARVPANIKPAKTSNKKNLLIGIVAVIAFFYVIGKIMPSGNSSSKEENTVDTKTITEDAGVATIYDDAEIVDLMNGLGTKKIGTISVAHADSTECTEENLLDWYLNYVAKNSDCNYHIIVYNDISNKGVFSNGFGSIQKDVEIIKDNHDSYSMGDDAGATYYFVDKDKESITVNGTMANSDIVEKVKEVIDGIIPDEYKHSELYLVEVAGEEGNLDCNITVVNEEFANANYQSIAEELAKKIKDQDLGIGYFSIAFQNDDYTLNAVSSLSDLKTEEPTEIETNVFENNKTELSKNSDIDEDSLASLSEEEKMELFVTLMEASVGSNFGQDNYSIDRDGKIITLNVWQDGIAQGVALAAQGNEETKTAWIGMKSNVEGMAKNVYSTFEQMKIEDGHICVNVLNDVDKSKVLLTVLDGVTVYDVID